MNTRKPIAIVAAMLITAAGMTGIANYNASVQIIPTLPTINVSPTPEQLRELRDQGAKGGASAANGNDARMPYYSFASDEAGA